MQQGSVPHGAQQVSWFPPFFALEWGVWGGGGAHGRQLAS